MWSWLRFFKKYNFTITFLILSIFCLWLFIYNSEIHQAYFFKISSFIVSPFNKLSSNISYYFSLKKENEKLAIENLILNDRLHNSINVKCISVSDSTFLIPDSLKNLYSFLPARLISMTIHESKNYAVIEKGRREGISENSGVYTPNGILGIVSSVSDRYTLLKTYMHPDVKISAAINNNYVGIAQWDRKHIGIGEIINVPFAMKINIGDTIFTSAYSTFFPPNIPIGVVTTKYFNPDNQSMTYKFNYLENLDRVYFVYVVKFIDNDQIMQLNKNK